MESWLSKTNQTWKITLAVGMLFIEFAVLVLGWFKIYEIPLSFGTRLLIVYATMFWYFFSVRCPCCNKFPVFKIIRSVRISEMYQSIVGFVECPLCGYTGIENDSKH